MGINVLCNTNSFVQVLNSRHWIFFLWVETNDGSETNELMAIKEIDKDIVTKTQFIFDVI